MIEITKDAEPVVKGAIARLIEIARACIWAWVCVCATVLALSSAFANSTTPSGSSEKAALEGQMTAWLEQQGLPKASKPNLNDRRLIVPNCSKPFKFSRSGPTSRLIEVTCTAPIWQRWLKLASVQTRSTAASTAATWVTFADLAAGAQLTAENVRRVQRPTRQIPRNALRGIDTVDGYFVMKPVTAGDVLLTEDIGKMQKVVIVTRTLPTGAPLTRDSVILESRLLDVPKDALKTLEGLNLFTTNRTVEGGSVLTKRLLTRAKLIRRGDSVLVSADGSGYAIQSQATALEDGYLGERIKVRSNDSGKDLFVKITGESKAVTIK